MKRNLSRVPTDLESHEKLWGILLVVRENFIYYPCFSAVALSLLHFSYKVQLLLWVSPHCKICHRIILYVVRHSQVKIPDVVRGISGN